MTTEICSQCHRKRRQSPRQSKCKDRHLLWPHAVSWMPELRANTEPIKDKNSAAATAAGKGDNVVDGCIPIIMQLGSSAVPLVSAVVLFAIIDLRRGF